MILLFVTSLQITLARFLTGIAINLFAARYARCRRVTISQIPTHIDKTPTRGNTPIQTTLALNSSVSTNPDDESFVDARSLATPNSARDNRSKTNPEMTTPVTELYEKEGGEILRGTKRLAEKVTQTLLLTA